MTRDDEMLQRARELDASDPLRKWRDEFYHPLQEDGEPFIYLCGNSLGLQPKRTRGYVSQELDDWAQLGVEGHFHAAHPWMPYHEFLTGSTARLVGAQEHEVVVMNSLTVNLHLLMVSFYRPTSQRYKIIIESDAFPSDLYAVESQIRHHGLDPADALIRVAPAKGDTILEEEVILQAIAQAGDELALVMIGGVNYYTGQYFDLKQITDAAHAQGAIAGFDLAHAAGNVPVQLHDWKVDFACWCSYKYINSGPGGMSGVYIHERHARDTTLERFAGWWGHDQETRFLMGDDFHAMPTAEGWQLSNPPILAMAALRASMSIFDEVGMQALREKSLRLTDFLLDMLTELGDSVVQVITPTDHSRRGAQLSLRVLSAHRKLFDEITAAGVIADWREPDVIRIAAAPLYNTYTDLTRFYLILKQTLSKN